jgi:LPS export ABC transporter protein LptC
VTLRPRAAILFFAALTAAGCSLNYEAAELPEAATENIPDTVAVGLTHRIVKDSRLSFEMEAARAETFNARKQTILTSARFVEYDEKGGHATEGKADTVVYHTDTENAEISGSVSVHSAVEKGSISTQSLAWENKEKRLTAEPNELVVVRKDDGSYISGRGFIGDFRSKIVRFTGPVEGQYVYEK